MSTNFLELPALKVSQPLGDFFITKFRAADLMKVSFVEELTYTDAEGHLKGTQRKKDVSRLKEIARYIDSTEMAFPNSIILAANYNPEGEVVEDENESEEEGKGKITWQIEKDGDNFYKIIIPQAIKLAAIIDGQHRTKAFEYISNEERNQLELPCAVFFDLPNAYQAFLFATINGNQRKVDRSLALEQFGFNVEDEARKSWTPEKLAVYFSRKLNISESSPFHKHIKVAPGNERILFNTPRGFEWTVSTATVVDGILSLISSKPKRDRVEMAQTKLFGRSRDMVGIFTDSAPLRPLYLANQDDNIIAIVESYFKTVSSLLWAGAKADSYIIKTVGVLALFDFLKRILTEKGVVMGFEEYILPVKDVDFSDNFFQASGVGRSRIKHVLFSASGLKRSTEKVSSDNEQEIYRLINYKF